MEDLCREALVRWPRVALDYVDGDMDGEVSVQRNVDAFREFDLVPRVLRDVVAIDTSTKFVGAAVALPLALAPTGYTRMMHHDGERAAASVHGARERLTACPRWRPPHSRTWRGTLVATCGSSSTSGATAD